MASPTITKDMREKIVANMSKHIFGKEEAALVVRTAKIAERAYKEKYSDATRRKMEDLGKDFVGRSDDIVMNVNGLSIELSFNGYSRLYGRCIGSGKETVYRFVSKDHGSYRDIKHVASAALAADVMALMDDIKNFSDRVCQAEIQTLAVLESVRTFKKLRAVWPQGEKFYDMYDVDSEKPGVPSIVITDLNKMLGLK